MSETTVRRDEDASRYEIRIGGTLAGFAEYDLRPGVVRFLHTEIDPAFRGRGLGERLLDEALPDAAASGAAIAPLCPFVAAYLRTHGLGDTEIRWPEPTPD